MLGPVTPSIVGYSVLCAVRNFYPLSTSALCAGASACIWSVCAEAACSDAVPDVRHTWRPVVCDPASGPRPTAGHLPPWGMYFHDPVFCTRRIVNLLYWASRLPVILRSSQLPLWARARFAWRIPKKMQVDSPYCPKMRFYGRQAGNIVSNRRFITRS